MDLLTNFQSVCTYISSAFSTSPWNTDLYFRILFKFIHELIQTCTLILLNFRQALYDSRANDRPSFSPFPGPWKEQRARTGAVPRKREAVAVHPATKYVPEEDTRTRRPHLVLSVHPFHPPAKLEAEHSQSDLPNINPRRCVEPHPLDRGIMGP